MNKFKKVGDVESDDEEVSINLNNDDYPDMSPSFVVMAPPSDDNTDVRFTDAESPRNLVCHHLLHNVFESGFGQYLLVASYFNDIGMLCFCDRGNVGLRVKSARSL